MAAATTPPAPTDATKQLSQATVTKFQWRHLPGLDGLRGVAVMLVLMHHLVLVRIYGLSERVDRFVHSGWMGVDLFFVLSGFLITGILLDAKGTERRFTNFYMRRFLRIFPLYYGMLLVVLVILPAIVTRLNIHSNAINNAMESIYKVQGQQIYLWLYLQNMVDDWYMFNHFWSLAVEEHFYLFWPALIFLCTPRQSFYACIGLIVMAPLCRMAFLHYDIPFSSVHQFTLCRMDSLALGGLAALVARQRGLPSMQQLGKAIALVFALVLLVLVATYGGVEHYSYFTESIGYTLIAIGFTGVVLVTAGAPVTSWWGWLMQRPILMSLGKYSYGAYVYHRFLARPLIVALPPAKMTSWFGSPLLAAIVFFVIAVIVTYIVSFASWHLYEKHFLNLKRYFDYRKEPPVHPTAEAEIAAT